MRSLFKIVLAIVLLTVTTTVAAHGRNVGRIIIIGTTAGIAIDATFARPHYYYSEPVYYYFPPSRLITFCNPPIWVTTPYGVQMIRPQICWQEWR